MTVQRASAEHSVFVTTASPPVKVADRVPVLGRGDGRIFLFRPRLGCRR